MKSVTPTELRANIYKLLDEVLKTGIPLEVRKGGRTLTICPDDKPDKFRKLITRPDVILGDPEELVEISWEDEVQLGLP